jgi:hypothetical protein
MREESGIAWARRGGRVDRHVVHTDFYPNTDMHSDRLIIIAVQYTWSSLVLGEQVVLGTLITHSNSLKLI